MKLVSLILLYVLSVAVQRATAFPEMTRHGYTQCTACHVSPSGGSILTPYGRQLAGELMSTWSYTRESQFLHGALPESMDESNLMFGGDVRSIQIHREDSTAKDGKFFLMQANFDLAYRKGPVTAAISIGQIEEPLSGRVQGNLYANKYYGMYNLTDALAIRAGRFYPQFGINMPDHVLVTKTGAGFRPGMEFDTLEASMLTEPWSLFAATAKSSYVTPKTREEESHSAHATYNFKERFKVGASHRYSQTQTAIRRYSSASAILGFTEQVFNLTEVVWANNSSASTDGLFAMTRLGYEVHKGVVPYAQYQHQHSDLENKQVTKTYTLGANLFPRPHWEISGQWSKVRSPAEWSDDAYLLVHYYF